MTSATTDSASMKVVATFHIRLVLGACIATAICTLASNALGFRWFNTGGKQHGYEIFPVYSQYATDSPDVVMLGSSSTRWGTIPRLIELRLEQLSGRECDVWSMGIHGGIAPQLDFLIEHAFADGRRPQIVLVEATPSYWNELRVDNAVMQYWKWFAPTIQTIAGSFTRPWQQTSLGLSRVLSGPRTMWRAAAAILYPRLTDEWHELQEFCADNHGGFWSESQIAADLVRDGVLSARAKENARIALKQQLARFEPLAIGEHWEPHLDNARKVCAAHGAKLVLFATPFGPDFHQIKNQQSDDIFHAWLESYSDDVLLLDWSNPDFLRPGDFFNAGHLAPSGAVAVSEHLAAELYPLLTRRTPSMVVPSTH